MTSASPGTFRKIVAVCTGDARDAASLRTAAGLTRSHGGQLLVLGVVTAGHEVQELARHAGIEADEIIERMQAELRTSVDPLVAQHCAGIGVTVQIRAGKPFLEIIHEVIDNQRDLVIKAAEPFDGLRRYLFTSTDQHLLRKCPCPVWLVTDDLRTSARSVVAAVDVDDDNDVPRSAGLNATILDTAVAIADHSGAPLHLVHVWDAPAEDMVRRWSTDDDGPLRYVLETMGQHERALDALVADVRARNPRAAELDIKPHLTRGAPRIAIAEQVKALNADLLVMGTLTRTGVPGLIIGNTAEDVLNAVECSVVTVKPPGYVSPVAGIAR